MMIRAMLWPTFALVTLVFVVGAILVRRRVTQLRRTPPTRADFATGEATGAYFHAAELPTANLANLFERPVVYLALVPLVPLLLLTAQAGVAQVVLAWSYVALRAAHSAAHLTRRVRWRFALFLASNGVLAAMWVGFAFDLGRSGR